MFIRQKLQRAKNTLQKDKYYFRINLTINWSAIIAVSIFWIWVIYDYPSGSPFAGIGADFVLAGLFSYFCMNCYNNIYISRLPIRVFWPGLLITGTIIIILSWHNLDQGLYSDQVYHSSLAVRHAQLILFMIIGEEPGLWSMVSNWPASTVIHLINLIFLITMALAFFALWFLPRLDEVTITVQIRR